MKTIPLSEPVVTDSDVQHVRRCLESGWVSSQGPYVETFEEAVRKYTGARYATAVSNGTAALHLGLMACGVGEKDEVLVPALTFVAAVNVVRYCQASPVFVDCEPATLGINVQKTIEFLKEKCREAADGRLYNKRTGRLIKAIIPVHIFGHPVDMAPLMTVARRHNISVIEDATEALGSLYKNKHVGTLGLIGCLSFNGNKIITTGGGGMVITDSPRIAKFVKHLSNQAKKDPVAYHHDMIGYNYRLNAISAALGVGQIERLDKSVDIKRRNAELYREKLMPLGIDLLWEEPWARSNFWLCTIRIRKSERLSMLNYLQSKGIQARPIWKLIPNLPMYKQFQVHSIDNAVNAYETCLNIPSSVSLTKSDIDFIVRMLGRYRKIKL